MLVERLELMLREQTYAGQRLRAAGAGGTTTPDDAAAEDLDEVAPAESANRRGAPTAREPGAGLRGRRVRARRTESLIHRFRASPNSACSAGVTGDAVVTPSASSPARPDG